MPFDGACGRYAPMSRRSLLKSTALAGASWFTPLAHQLSRAAESGKSRPKSLIVLWMEGGISQLDSFDPHAGSMIAAGAKDIATAASGVRFGTGLPLTAEIARDFAVLRSVTGREGDHTRATYNAKTGYRPLAGLEHPSIGAVLCHELPGEGLDIPAHISILAGQHPGRGGYLGPRFDAFKTDDPDKPLPDLRSSAKEPVQAARMDALAILEKTFARGRIASLESERTMHQGSIERARRMMGSEQLAAFDVSLLPASERDCFGDTPFGRSCLAAVRLVEAGVRCVEVTLRGWDTHINNAEGQATQLAILDPALASLFKTLRERDLYEDTVVLVATEFGRTPKLNVTEGRDHWPHGFSVLLGGGGFRGGIAVGETDPTGEKKEPSREIRVEDIHATILKKFGINYQEELLTPIGRPLALSDGRVIAEVM